MRTLGVIVCPARELTEGKSQNVYRNSAANRKEPSRRIVDLRDHAICVNFVLHIPEF
jgi:hypothetical protein